MILLQLLIRLMTCLICVCVCVCAQQMTLRRLLDHLKLVASYHEVNKMTCQNLAVCFGPVLLSQRQEASCHTNRVFIDSEELASALHFKKHIEVLHYLLQLWPGEHSFYAGVGMLNTSPSNHFHCPRNLKPVKEKEKRDEETQTCNKSIM